MGYIWQTLWDIVIKICDILGKNYRIYWAKTIVGKKYGIYWVKIMGNIMGYIGLKLLNIFGKTLVYTGPLDILINNYGIYSSKATGYI